MGYHRSVATLKEKPRKTLDDFRKLPEGVRAELIEGELFMSPSPRERHQRAVLNLGMRLQAFANARSLGRVYVAPFDVHLPTGDVVEPDLLFVSSERLGIISDWVRGAPDLAIEVLSPENPERDRIVKRALYARAGVREYWIVDPQERSVESFALDGTAFTAVGFFREGERVMSPLLAGLDLPIAEIFS